MNDANSSGKVKNIRADSSADRRAWLETVGAERTEDKQSVRKSVLGVVPRVTIRVGKRVFRCEIDCGEES
jgi:hypothetical protein